MSSSGTLLQAARYRCEFTRVLVFDPAVRNGIIVPMADFPDEDLRAWSYHLFYEYDMMLRTARVVDAQPDVVLKSAVLESFLVHVRNLLVFFSLRKKVEGRKKKHRRARSDDLRAKHYVPDFKAQGAEDFPISDLYEKISARIAHLSLKRPKQESLNEKAPSESWPVREIADALYDEVERFAKLAKNRLHDCWLQPRDRAFARHSHEWPRVPTMMAKPR